VSGLADPSAGHVIFTTLVTGAEIVGALVRRVRIGSTPAADAAQAIATFRGEFHRAYQVVGVTDAVVELAMDLAERHGLRGYDAIQLACALTAQARLVANRAGPLTFLSADVNLNATAATEGLIVDNPNDHS
jgi:uncharacterized protein